MNDGLHLRPERNRGKWHIRAVYSGKWWRERGQKGLSAIPHLFTLLNLAFGIFSIMLTMRGEYEKAALMILGSLFADGLDGRIARLLNADGEFGKELDSLADVVSFGAAPAILIYQMHLQSLGYAGMTLAIIFPICGALRLARFNIIKTSGFFMGLPIPAAGLLLCAFAFFTVQTAALTPWPMLIPILMVLLSYLMISTIPYPDFKHRRKQQTPISVAPAAGPLLMILAVWTAARFDPWSVVILPLIAYVTLGPWLLLLKQWTEKVQPRLMGSDRQ